jgi:polyisoprenoid-binding protein YceI
MNKLLPILLALCCIAPLHAKTLFTVDSDLSSVHLATIKKQYVVEPAQIKGLQGKLDDQGKFVISFPISKLDTGVGIRNARLSSLYFNATKFADVTVKGQIDKAIFKQENTAISTEIAADVSLFGQTKTLVFPVTLVKSTDIIVVSSSKPVIVSGEDFGIPVENLNAVAATVGNISLSGKVPVSLNLILTK